MKALRFVLRPWEFLNQLCEEVLWNKSGDKAVLRSKFEQTINSEKASKFVTSKKICYFHEYLSPFQI